MQRKLVSLRVRDSRLRLDLHVNRASAAAQRVSAKYLSNFYYYLADEQASVSRFVSETQKRFHRPTLRKFAGPCIHNVVSFHQMYRRHLSLPSGFAELGAGDDANIIPGLLTRQR